MSHHDNFLLSRLNPEAFDRLKPNLTVVNLHQGAVLGETYKRVEKVYFPHSGVISFIVETIGGAAVSTGMIGKDGVYGAIQALDDKVALSHAVVQIPGTASIANPDVICQIAVEFADVRKLLIDYDQFFLSQVQQTAACNAVHLVQERICKWLLRMHELAGPDLPLTQEFLAQMMGVRRNTVTEVAIRLQEEGVISYTRGRLRIENVDRLDKMACECAKDIKSHFQKIFEAFIGRYSQSASAQSKN